MYFCCLVKYSYFNAIKYIVYFSQYICLPDVFYCLMQNLKLLYIVFLCIVMTQTLEGIQMSS